MGFDPFFVRGLTRNCTALPDHVQIYAVFPQVIDGMRLAFSFEHMSPSRHEPQWHELPLNARVYIFLVAAAGAALLLASPQRGAFSHPALLIIFICASAAASAIKIDLPLGWSHSTLSIGYAVSYASLLLLGPGATSWVAMAGGLAQCRIVPKTKTPTEWFRTIFSMAGLALSMESAAQILRLMNSHGLSGPADLVIAAIVASALACFFVNSLLVAAVLALSTRRSLLRVWDQELLWSAPNYLIGAFAAAVGVYGYRDWRYARFALLSLPLLLTYRLYKVYLGRMDDERRHVREISEMHMSTVESLALAIEAKDTTSRSHVHRVRFYATALALKLGLPDDVIEGIRTAALLHDIGHLGVPDHILSKPGSLTGDEFRKVRLHPEIGAGIVSAVKFPYPVAPLIRSHHEQWDGKGYPDGLKGDEIPIGARVVAVADRFDTLQRDRPYRRAIPYEEALIQLRREAGKGLDPTLVDRFLEILPAIQRESDLLEVELARLANEPVAERRDVLQDIARARQELVQLFDQAHAESITDALTELPNRRFLAAHVSREITRTQRIGSPFAVLMIDVNEFKQINDRHGHLIGDAVLKEVGQALKRCLRPYDVCCRYGGDEFVVALHGCSREMADHKTVELRGSVSAIAMEVGGVRVPVTCSFGLAICPVDASTYEGLVEVADSRMYSQKIESRGAHSAVGAVGS
jgi:diguanylate cyclase (GGDEF)-like protein/putative nucleotidyltransferase with HDIG domain